MTDDNTTLRLPSGAIAVRTPCGYHFSPSGVCLTPADVEALFADSLETKGPCDPLARYVRREHAAQAVPFVERRTGLRVKPVPCDICGGFHLQAVTA